MKRYWGLMILLFIVSASVFGQIIDQPVARVKLTKPEVITQKQLKKQIELVEKQTRQPVSFENRKKMLDLQVGELLINQAAARDNFRVSDAEVFESIEQYKNSINPEMTDAQFRVAIQNQLDMSFDDFITNMRQRLVQEKYVQEKKRNLFQIDDPTESQIKDLYGANATDFINPQMVRFNHIYIDTRKLGEAERAQAQKRAEDALRELKTTPFKDVAVKYSDDTKSKYRGGDFGYLARNDAQRQMLLGRSFYEAVFALNLNQISGIIQSNVGLHIVQITDRRDAKLLGLDDPIFPGETMTVRERIKHVVLAQQRQRAFQTAANELIQELRKNAEVTVYEQNLSW